MKKLLLTLSIILASTAFAQEEGGNGFFSKIEFGVRANGLINTTSLEKFKDVKELEEHGFNVGVAAKFNVTEKFFITPEVYYSYVGMHEFTMPVLLGYSMFNNKLDVIAGPNLIYTLSTDSFQAMPNFDKNNTVVDFYYNGFESVFDIGYVAGLQYHLGKFMVTARYQGAFNGKEIEYSFYDEDFVVYGEGKEKLKSSFVSLGIGYNF